MNAREKSNYRISQRIGSSGGKWKIKQAPGWKLIAARDTLLECADYLRANTVADIHAVPVACNQHPWPTLGQLLAEGKEPS